MGEMNNKVLEAAVTAIEEKNGKNICIIDLRDKGVMFDYFVICNGSSSTNVQAIADGIQKDLRTNIGERATHVEGRAQAEWVLLDYFDILIHVFLEEKREFYALEEMWADAPITYIEEK